MKNTLQTKENPEGRGKPFALPHPPDASHDVRVSVMVGRAGQQTLSHQKGLPEVAEQGQETGPRLSVWTKPQAQGVSESFNNTSLKPHLLGARLHARASGTGMPALNSSSFNRESSL